MRTWLLTVAAAAHASVALAQGAAPSRDTAQVMKELVTIEQEIARANKECDYKYFARIEAAEFIFTGANGHVTTRAEDLAGEKDCRKSNQSPTLDEFRMQLHGSVAILSARSTSTSQGAGGAPMTRRSRFTDVFVWRDRRWQLVSGHSSNIPPGK